MPSAMFINHAVVKLNVLCFIVAAPIVAGGAEPQPTLPLKVASGQPLGAEYLIQFSLGLIVVLMAVVALAWLMRRVNRFQSSVGDSLQTLGGISLGPRERIVLVRVGETQLLLGVAPGRVQTLHVLDQPILNTDDHATRTDRGVFRKRLASALRRAELSQETSS